MMMMMMMIIMVEVVVVILLMLLVALLRFTVGGLRSVLVHAIGWIVVLTDHWIVMAVRLSWW
jgi:hypothetical protein